MAGRKAVNKIIYDQIIELPFDEKHIADVETILKENFSKPWTQDNILSSNSFSFKKVFLYGDAVIAFLDSNIIFDEAELLMLAVKKEYQNHGIGSYILNRYLEHLKSKNIKSIYLEVSENNIKAINLYKKFGFEVYGKRENYYSDNSSAILMKKSLVSSV